MGHHGKGNYAMKNILGEDAFVLVNQVFHLVFGWSAYLLSGATGGSEYGLTNHFVPVKPFSDGLFPTETHKKKGWISAIGALTFASTKVGFLPIFLLYVLPYMACNFWLVLYTWLQHTDVDVPHFNGDEWDWVKGTFMTIDRPYGPVLDFLHHRIGSTHVAHHVAHTIPHYHPRKRPKPLRRPSPRSTSMTPPPSTRPCGASRGTASPCTSTTTSMSSTPRTRPSRRRKRLARRGRREGPHVVPAAPQFAPFFKFSL